MDVIERFAVEHFTLNSISERRRQQVRAALAKLDSFVECSIEEATDDDLYAWMAELLDDGLAPSTVRFHLKIAREFYNWCWRRRVIDAEAIMRLREVKSPRGSGAGLPRPYTSRELVRFWAELEARWPAAQPAGVERWLRGNARFRGSLRRWGMRIQLDAIIALALECGLRGIEIYRLAIDDCHWDNKYIVVHGKREDQNDKQRDVPYPPSAAYAVARWWRLRTALGARHDALWLSVTYGDPASPLSKRRLEGLLQTFGDWHLHRLRHTCATERLRAGMAIEELQGLLGHANIAQTLGYAQLLRSDIHRAAARSEVDFQRRIRPAA